MLLKSLQVKKLTKTGLTSQEGQLTGQILLDKLGQFEQVMGGI